VVPAEESRKKHPPPQTKMKQTTFCKRGLFEKKFINTFIFLSSKKKPVARC